MLIVLFYIIDPYWLCYFRTNWSKAVLHIQLFYEQLYISYSHITRILLTHQRNMKMKIYMTYNYIVLLQP